MMQLLAGGQEKYALLLSVRKIYGVGPYRKIMKRIEAIIRSEKLDATVTSLQKIGVPATIYEAKGVGKGEKYTIKYGLGTGSAKMLYSDRKTVVTVVDDGRVREAVDAIKAAAAGSSTTGIIFVSAVDEAIAF